MFQQAMKEQGQSHSSTADVSHNVMILFSAADRVRIFRQVMKAAKSKSLDAWAASGGMPRV
jgi:hypothetical protein